MNNKLIPLCFLLLAPATAAVPTPESHFGHKIGVDNELLDWDKVVTYFQALEKSSDRLKFMELGKTVEGRPQIAVVISSALNIKNLEHYHDIQLRLADPRKTPPAETARLFQEGKTVVMITCSIHATEVASTHTSVEFAYRLLTEDNNPKFKAILDNVIILLEPSQNPDGVDIVTRWYRRTRGTPYDGTSPPELYHHYVGHDDNRDWYIFTQPETRNTATLENKWHPQIVYDVHQMGENAARLFVPPWMDPADPNIDPILASICNMIGTGVATDLYAAGKTGIALNGVYDFWSPARQYQAYHGGARILTESASAKLATPITLTADQITENALGYNPRVRSWNYLVPWMGGTWHLRDIIDYQSIAWESLLYQAATKRADLLRYFYDINKNNVERKAPYAFVVPSVQSDPGAAKKMLETLAFGDTEIDQVGGSFESDGKSYPAGSYVMSMHQPFSGWAKTLLERQDYPDLRLYPGGPPKRPYDVTAQTLPLQMGVTTITAKDSFQASLKPATAYSFKLDHSVARGGWAATDVMSWKEVAKVWKSGKPIYRDMSTGDFFTSSADGRTEIAAPRIGLYQAYVPSMDEGWTRWLFDEFGFAQTKLVNSDIKAGHLRQQFDTIIIPDQSRQAIADGYRDGAMPPVVDPAFAQSIYPTPILAASQLGIPPALKFSTLRDFAPRIGFAWRLGGDNKTVLRGGYGRYIQALLSGAAGDGWAVAGSDVGFFANSLGSNGKPAFTLPYSFPANIAQPGTVFFDLGVQIHNKDPIVEEWSLALERDLGKGVGLRLSYEGNHSYNMPIRENIDQMHPNTSGYNLSQTPFPLMSDVWLTAPVGYGNHDSGTISVRKRTSSLQFEGSYVYTRDLTNVNGIYSGASGYVNENGNFLTDPYNPSLDYGNTPYARRHRVLATFLYELPFGKEKAFLNSTNRLVDRIVGGWVLSGIALFQSGPFMSVVTLSDPSGTGFNIFNGIGGRADTVSSVNPYQGQSIGQWINPNAFADPGNNIGRFGDSTAGSVLGPGTKYVSLSLLKRIQLTESSRIEIGAQVANVTNHPNYNPPGNLTVGVPGFGALTSMQTAEGAGPRAMQLVARITF